MNQCVVPSWHFEENPTQSQLKFPSHSNSLIPESLDYEVAELTWENGQLAMQGLGLPRVPNKPPATWDKPRAGGTLESIVNQATGHPHPKPAAVAGGHITNGLAPPWFNPAATMDALVPCNQEGSTHVQDMTAACSTLVGSCSGAVPTVDGGAGPRVGTNISCRTNGSMSESATCGGADTHHPVTLETWERELGVASPEKTISGQDYTKASGDHDHFFSHTKSQSKTGDEEGKRKLSIGKTSIATKRSKAAATHNQSERKRRDKINQRMKTLQKLVPNSSKTDKASMLDEVIEYLKQLQAQVHMMNRMNMPSMNMNMMLPLAMQQQLRMSMMGMGMGMGMGVMDMNAINRAAAFMPPSWDNLADCLPTGSVMPDSLASLLALQSQPMTMDAYSRLAAMHQQMQQPPGPK